jgi:two-component system, cell cycle response regulator DivK
MDSPTTRESTMGQCVLLVEDDPDHRAIYRVILEHFGFEVLEAGDGEEAIRLARGASPSLILMDISIPIVDGWEATRILQANSTTRSIPVIALTGHVTEQDRRTATEVGCRGFLTKPCPPLALARAVEEWIGPAASPPEGNSSFGCIRG